MSRYVCNAFSTFVWINIYSNLTGFRESVRFNDRFNDVASHFTSILIRKTNCNEYIKILNFRKNIISS